MNDRLCRQYQRLCRRESLMCRPRRKASDCTPDRRTRGTTVIREPLKPSISFHLLLPCSLSLWERAKIQRFLSPVDHFLDEHWQLARRLVANFVRRPNSRRGPLTSIQIGAVDRADHIAGTNFIADLNFAHESDRRIDLI